MDIHTATGSYRGLLDDEFKEASLLATEGRPTLPSDLQTREVVAVLIEHLERLSKQFDILKDMKKERKITLSDKFKRATNLMQENRGEELFPLSLALESIDRWQKEALSTEEKLWLNTLHGWLEELQYRRGQYEKDNENMIHTLPVIYTAGPFTADTAFEVELNVMEMRKIALEIAKLGAVPLCPHANTSFFHDQLTPEFWYKSTMELLRRCDAVVLHPYYLASKGSRREHEWAQDHRLPQFYYSKELGFQNSGIKRWIDDFGKEKAQGSVFQST